VDGSYDRSAAETRLAATPPPEMVALRMKVLIVGRGVVGTFYGWALSQSGAEVTHIVRRDALPPSVTIGLLDLRAGRSNSAIVTYTPRTVRAVVASDAFDLVIVATTHDQAVAAVRHAARIRSAKIRRRNPALPTSGLLRRHQARHRAVAVDPSRDQRCRNRPGTMGGRNRPCRYAGRKRSA
jgi:glycine/D-amino acid oxidase-like deaminating enzyme